MSKGDDARTHRTHRPPGKPPRGMTPSPQHKQELAIASAAQAVALLCEKLVELVEVVIDELNRED
jgi:hypothetical protein